jgi:acetyl esterase
MARSFAVEGDLIVVAVNYRLAPENKFPAALMDCYSTLTWVFNNLEHRMGFSWFELHSLTFQ